MLIQDLLRAEQLSDKDIIIFIVCSTHLFKESILNVFILICCSNDEKVRSLSVKVGRVLMDQSNVDGIRSARR